jgi:nitroreductase/NAD-dependent dihydropyrimidine dehydrogenase PreA subunit
MPTINLEKCTHCLKCEKDCPSGAIKTEEGKIYNSCIHCGHCVAICPEAAVNPDKGAIVPLTETTITPEEFCNLSTGLRSCRRYMKKPVSKEAINKLIENMKHYPSASNARPVQITVVQTKENVQKLNDRTAESLIKTLNFITNPILKPFLKVLAPSVNTNGLKKYKKLFIEKKQNGDTSQICHNAPMVMLFHAPESKFGMASSDAHIWATYTSIFAKTMGLGSCFIGFIIKAMESDKKLRKEFNIPIGQKVLAALTIGHPKVKYLNETSREEPKFKTM